MSITYLIIGSTVVISMLAFNNGELLYKLKHWPYAESRRGEYYRWLTAGFLHADWMHLLFNMLTLYFFGADQRPAELRGEGGYFPGVEGWFVETFSSAGGLMYLVFYLVAIVVASLGTYFRHRHNAGFASIGASGAVSAVLYAAILLHPTMSLYLFFIPIPIPGFIYGILYLWYSSYAARRGGDGIDHLAHFYGAVFGFSLPLLIQPGLLGDFFAQLSAWVGGLGG